MNNVSQIIDNVDNKVCPDCGGSLDNFTEGSCMGLRCSSCGWSVVATQLFPIDEDTKVYTLKFKQEQNFTKSTYSAIAKVVDGNFLKVKSLLKNPAEYLIKKNAREMLAIKNLLDDADVKYSIEPEYKYTVKDVN